MSGNVSIWKTLGQDKTVDWLQRALANGGLSHAYLLVGPPQVGKMTLAIDLAMTLNCQAEPALRPCSKCPACLKIAAGKHADIQLIALNQDPDDEEKDRKLIGIGQINTALHSANLPPFEGAFRVYIIDEAENLSPDAANRLLKTLEEPPQKVIFILLTGNIRLIPATIVSRCQRLNLGKMKTAAIEDVLRERGQIDNEKARLLSRLSHGCPGWALTVSTNPAILETRQEAFSKMQAWTAAGYCERFAAVSQLALQFNKKRESVYELLETWAGWWRDILLVKTGCNSDIVSLDYLSALSEMAGTLTLGEIVSALKSLTQAVQQLRLNANPRLVLEALMLNLPKTGLRPAGSQPVEVKNA